MQNGFDIITTIIVIGVIQGSFLAFIILRTKHGNLKANKYLSLLLLCFAVSLINIPLIRMKLYQHRFYLLNYPLNLTFLFGPFFYLYVRHLTDRSYLLKKNDLWHFLPFSTVFLYFLKFYLSDTAFKTYYVETMILSKHIPAKHYDFIIVIVLAQIHMWLYLWCIHRLLTHHKKQVKQLFSTIDNISLDWLQFFLRTFMVSYIIFLLLSAIIFTDYRNVMYGVLGVIVTVTIFILGYKGLKQPELLFTVESFTPNRSPSSPPELTKNAHEYLKQLDTILLQENLYKNPDLTLVDLANRLSIPRSTLSQIINEAAKMNFYDFINHYRVNAVTELLTNPEYNHLTIVSLAAEAGFASKSSFNRAFKRFTGMTPTEYKNNSSNQ